MKKFLLLLLLIGITFFFQKNASAQGVTTASVNGVVTDNQGGIPGATVTITHLPTGTVYATVTRNDGRYNIPNLRVGGPYTFKVTFIGFKDYVQEGITLSIGQDQRISTKLQDNTTSLSEVVVTGSQGKVINSSRTGARETITRSQIENLPTISRSLQDFTKLTPSANGLAFGGRASTYNNITVDGALFNNSFGLSGTLGGQTNSQPISLDAIDQIQVDIAPYDVRQGNFTGAGVNTVVKSGTNTVKGTAYYFARGAKLQGYHVGPINLNPTPVNYHTNGLAVGGPIIKNKLFLFVSGEQERITQPPSSVFVAGRSGLSGANVSATQAATLDAIKTKLASFGYDPGAYEGYNYRTSSDKVTVKLDWNIDKNNVLSAKYFYLKSFRDQPASNSGIGNGNYFDPILNKSVVAGAGTTRAPGINSLPFLGSGYTINNNFNIGIVELNTRISNTMSNKLTVGYSALRDFRSFLGNSALPMVDIGNGTSAADGSVITPATATATSFGSELFTAGNLLSTNIWQFADDFTIYKGRHEITIGTSNQIQSYLNGFAPNYNGLYTYNSASDFLNDKPALGYTLSYSAVGNDFPYAKIKASLFSVYAQDKYSVTDNFKLTYGVRADYSAFPTSLAPNANAAALTFQGGTHVDVSKLPKNRIQISPRIGFNWDVNGDQSTQIRGGTGLFTGQVPFVWISNQASNNGLLFGKYTVNKGVATNTTAQNNQLIFNPSVNANRPTAGAANTSYELDVADPNLRYPKIWRTNLAIDQKLPGGVIGTIEAAYTKDLQAIYHQNLVLSDGFTTIAGPEGQIRYDSKNTTAPTTTNPTSAPNPNITPGLYYMRNTNKGFSYFITGQLQKSFTNGFAASAAYTYTKSKDVNDGGSTAGTIWSTRYVAGNPNGDNLSNSTFVQPNRIIATVSYRKQYFKNAATTIGLIFEASNNGAVSYITSGDPNNDGATNDLMYIPKTSADIILVPNDAKDTRTPTQLWNQLNNFINQDKYLSANRGKFAERNGAILPTYKRLDLHIAQDFYVNAGKTKNTLQLTFDVINFANLLNRNWGTYQTSFTGFNNGASPVLRYAGNDATGRATYAFPYLDATNAVPLQSSYRNDININSRFQAQIGVRYTFN